MNLEELKKKLKEIEVSNIRVTRHASRRIQDKRRAINYNKVVNLIVSQDGLYKFEEQVAKNPDELKFKLWFRLNYVYDMNIYIVVIVKKEGLNSLKIVSAHKVKRQVQRKISKDES